MSLNKGVQALVGTNCSLVWNQLETTQTEQLSIRLHLGDTIHLLPSKQFGEEKLSVA